VIVVRLLWVFPGSYLPQMLSRRVREREPVPPPRNVVGEHTKMHMQSLMKRCCPRGQLSTKGRVSNG